MECEALLGYHANCEERTMKNNMKKIMVGCLLPIALSLSGCTIFDLVSSGSSSNATSVKGDGSLAYKMRDLYPYYMPSTGTVNILVIPVKFTDYQTVATASTRKKIETSFFGNKSDTGWESVSSFYSASSFGKLNIAGTVSDWYDCGYSTAQLSSLKSDEAGYDQSWTVLRKAVDWYKSENNTKCTEFDGDKDGLIDAVWLVYGAPHNASSELYWAYTYADSSVSSMSPKDPSPYYYSWASYDFMYSGYGSSSIDAHTYIHETGHLMGLDDYYVAEKDYDSRANYNPMGSIDMMDANVIDHNTFSKTILGWSSPQVVSGAKDYTISRAEKEGDCLIIPTAQGWNGSPFDEYMLLEFYKPDGLNEKDSLAAYPGNEIQGFSKSGIRIFHVDARLATTADNGKNYYYTETAVLTNSKYSTLAHSNSSGRNCLDNSYRLIQLMDATRKVNLDTDYYKKLGTAYQYMADNSSLFYVGDSFSYSSYSHSFPLSSKGTMNDGSKLDYKVTVKSITTDSAILTVEKA